MNEFLAMGGYAVYVWSAFGLAVAVLVTNVVFARRGLRLMRARVQQRITSRNTGGTT